MSTSMKVCRALLLFLAATWSAVAHAQDSTCNPNLQCCATIGTGTPCSTGVGNPINTQTGNKFQREVDMPALPGVLGLELIRYYNSNASGLYGTRGLFGRGWKMSYEIQASYAQGGVRLEDADGTARLYKPVAHKSAAGKPEMVYRSALAEHGQITSTADKTLVWKNAYGTEYQFSHKGQLTQITAATGEFTTIERDAQGRLIKVQDPQGRQLEFHYLPQDKAVSGAAYKGIQAVDTPVGQFQYAYGIAPPASVSAKEDRDALMANLVQVKIPQHVSSGQPEAQPSVARIYHYEDTRWPTLLTGISVKGQGGDSKHLEQRIVTWGYDARGRANLSVKGEPARLQVGVEPKRLVEGTGIEQVTLDYSQRRADGTGVTLLTNSLGKLTKYEYAKVNNSVQLVAVTGAGCATCGPVNIRYHYSKGGKQVLSSQSQANDYDAAGRLIREGATRYDYANDWSMQPNRMTRPSVVAGKHMVVNISYNSHGQPTQVTQIGFNPLEPSSAIERTTRYTYELINNRSVLKMVDGPLANGAKGDPSDSDVTLMTYDAKAHHLVSVEAPGNLKTSLQYDAAGRVVKRSMHDGYREVETNVQYAGLATIANEAQGISRIAKFALSTKSADAALPQTELSQTVLRARFDAIGRRVESKGSGELSAMLSYDTANYPRTLTHPDGVQEHWSYNKEGALLAHAYQDSAGKISDANMWLRDEQGRILAHLTPQGLQEFFVYPIEASSRAAQRGNSATPQKARQSSIIKQVLRDDFGRTVFERLPEDGELTVRFSSVPGGEVQTQTLKGVTGQAAVTEILSFDHAGRVTQRERAGCKDALQYQGMLLEALRNCESVQYFERDAFGQILAQRQQIDKVQYTQYFDYDPKGRLSQRRTVQGDYISYAYDGNTGQTNTVFTQRSWLTTLAGVFGHSTSAGLANHLPAGWIKTPFLTGIRRQSLTNGLALAGVTHGNGSEQRWSAPSSKTAEVPSTSPSTAHAQKVSYVPNLPFISASTIEAEKDLFGRQTHHTPSSGSNVGKPLTLLWNDAHQLIKIIDQASGQVFASYKYDGQGRRISKTVMSDKQAQTTHFVYDNQHRLIAQADQSGQVKRQYFYTDHRVHSIIEKGQVYAVRTDWRGLPDKVTDEQRHTVWEQSWDSWARTSAKPSSVFEMPLRLAGQYYDAESGLHYNIHRYLDPKSEGKQGRYISPDPMGAPNGPNRYAYVNGNPDRGIDPLGLFVIPDGAFFGSSSYYVDGLVGGPDKGHGDIVRAAFGLYAQKYGARFSQNIIDQIIVNNYHSDANGGTGCYSALPSVAGGGQCNFTNHFDNPNVAPVTSGAGAPYKVEEFIDPVTGKKAYRSTGEFRSTYSNINWISDSIDAINNNRNNYSWVDDRGSSGVDISSVLSSFGQNSHALADFYAHTNWVDNRERGGCWLNPEDRSANPERGWVPRGLNKGDLWQEGFDADVPLASLYSGTVGSAGEVKVQSHNIATHAYWEKDHDGLVPDEKPFTSIELQKFAAKNMFFWKATAFDPIKHTLPDFQKNKAGSWYSPNGTSASNGLKKGDTVLVAMEIKNRHQLAFHLAVEHTLQEIQKLWESAAGKALGATGKTLQQAFGLTKSQLGNSAIQYRVLWPKNAS